jgi:N-acetylmuramoyl-L-alanine amidase
MNQFVDTLKAGMIPSSSSNGWNLPSKHRSLCAATAVVVLLLLALPQGIAQTQVPPFNRDVVVLDPAHGGTDGGARISDSVQEKDVTLGLAMRLRSLLIARGFTVVSTRDGAGGDGLSTDQRAESANKAHAVACLVIHATANGNGVQIGTSTIGSPLASVAQTQTSQTLSNAVAWDRAQEVYVPESLKLANKVGSALARSNFTVSVGRVALRPLDNLMCPAVSIEIAPQTNSGGDATPVSDATYQQRVADAVAGALVFWRNQAQHLDNLSVPASAGRPDAGGPGA